MTPKNRGGDGGNPKDGDGTGRPKISPADDLKGGQEGAAKAFDAGRAKGTGGSDSRPGVDPNVAGPAGKIQLRPPNNRHNLNQIGPKNPPKDKNTIVLPEAREGVRQDIADIQAGNARWDPATNSYVTDSGRRYKVESNGTVFPVDGPGFVNLNRSEYKALQALIKHDGDVEAAKASVSRDPSIPPASFDKAGEVYQHYGE